MLTRKGVLSLWWTTAAFITHNGCLNLYVKREEWLYFYRKCLVLNPLPLTAIHTFDLGLGVTSRQYTLADDILYSPQPSGWQCINVRRNYTLIFPGVQFNSFQLEVLLTKSASYENNMHIWQKAVSSLLAAFPSPPPSPLPQQMFIVVPSFTVTGKNKL